MEQARWNFSERHMKAVRDTLGNLPAKTFFNVETADFKKDTENATDLVLEMGSGDIAVRIRKSAYRKYGDWTVRSDSNGHRTEIDKLREGFARWYFMGYSQDDVSRLACWWLLDMDKIRQAGILEKRRKPHTNGDGTAFVAIPIAELERAGCVVASGKNQVERQRDVAYAFAEIGGR